MFIMFWEVRILIPNFTGRKWVQRPDPGTDESHGGERYAWPVGWNHSTLRLEDASVCFIEILGLVFMLTPKMVSLKVNNIFLRELDETVLILCDFTDTQKNMTFG